jgi:hypothetical protein
MDVAQLQTLQNVQDGDLPRGDWTGKPAVPASTVAATNTSGHTMIVEIAAGTVTVVKVDNVTVGARTSGAFRVRNGSTIAITYSVAPTWQWFYA